MHTDSLPPERCTTMVLLSIDISRCISNNEGRTLTVQSHGRVVDHGDNIRLCVMVDRAVVGSHNATKNQGQTQSMANCRTHNVVGRCSRTSRRAEKRKKEPRLREHEKYQLSPVPKEQTIRLSNMHLIRILTDVMLRHMEGFPSFEGSVRSSPRWPGTLTSRITAERLRSWYFGVGLSVYCRRAIIRQTLMNPRDMFVRLS
jgi:hypothetical protein